MRSSARVEREASSSARADVSSGVGFAVGGEVEVLARERIRR